MLFSLRNSQFKITDNENKSQSIGFQTTCHAKSYETECTKESFSQKTAKLFRQDSRPFTKSCSVPKERFSQNTVTLHFKVSLTELLDKMRDAEPSFV
ncbi:unnamed protein product, partial [Rotaria socialis]